MKKMKALLALLAVALATLSPMASFAEDTTSGETLVQSGTMELRKKYDGGYKIVVPPSINDLTKGAKLQAGASDVVIAADKQLNISVQSQNNWNLVNMTDSLKSISYTVTKPDGEALKNGWNHILTITEATEKEVVELTVSNVENPTYAGDYIDVLTFTAQIVDKTVDNSTPTTETETTTTTEVPTEETTTTTTTTVSVDTNDDEGGEGNTG
ncbi:MAG: hypothetical protein K2K66_01735 [Ruminococcus sp.]|nr:hypothetical protein [Ruminococcus sp.]